MPRVLVVGQAARWTLKVVELHDDHLRPFGIDWHVDLWLHVPPAFELRALRVGERRILRRCGNCLRERGAFAREHGNERRGAAEEQDGDEQRNGTFREGAGVTRRAPRQCGHGQFRGSARNDEDSNDGNIGGHAQQADGLQLEERCPREVEHERQRDRRQYEDIPGDVLALRIVPPPAERGQEQHQREVQNAAERDRYAPEAAVAAQVRLRAAHGGADVAGARIGRVGDEAVVHVGGSGRRPQPQQREGHQQRSCP